MLDAQAIIANAEATVGIADSDIAPRHNLDALLASLRESFPMSPAGEASATAVLQMDTVNRLQTLKWLRDHPEIAEEPVKAPVFLMGLPRSGTTFLQYLFDRDHRFRLIRTWESMMPSPPAGFAPETVASRRETWIELQKKRPHFDGFDALHLYDEDGSDECHAFLEQSIGAAGLHNLYRVPAFFDYLLDEADLAETYRIHRRQLQCLQWRRGPKPWALKYPNHIIAMDAILEVYPDARFVMTHRDPVQALASIAKMTANLRGMKSAAPVDRTQVGSDMLHFISRHIDRIMDFDAGRHRDRVVDVDYYALAEDPVGVMQEIHRRLGIDTPEEISRAVAVWFANNPKNARGGNSYTLEQYGLVEHDVLARFAAYRRRFDIPREADGLTAPRPGPICKDVFQGPAQA
ncbi:sulfotransferase [Novosphingobium sp. BL-8H]|uniref:sulfotransferase family protein n=1 Tax=Novosphingobium sp. BL-8H TaxID=3127640 RepID=UPI003757C721